MPEYRIILTGALPVDESLGPEKVEALQREYKKLKFREGTVSGRDARAAVYWFCKHFFRIGGKLVINTASDELIRQMQVNADKYATEIGPSPYDAKTSPFDKRRYELEMIIHAYTMQIKAQTGATGKPVSTSRISKERTKKRKELGCLTYEQIHEMYTTLFNEDGTPKPIHIEEEQKPEDLQRSLFDGEKGTQGSLF
jgi:hypothetical protein